MDYYYFCTKPQVGSLLGQVSPILYLLISSSQSSKINKNIHASAVHFVVFSLLLQQIVLLCFNIVRGPGPNSTGVFNARVIVSITFIALYSLIFIGCFFWQAFKGISPIQVKRNSFWKPISPSVSKWKIRGTNSFQSFYEFEWAIKL